MPGTVLGGEDTAMNKTAPLLKELTVQWVETANNK